MLDRIQTANKRHRNPYNPDGRLPGALGRGQSVGVAIADFIKFWCYVTTVLGAIVAGQQPRQIYIRAVLTSIRPVARQVQDHISIFADIHRWYDNRSSDCDSSIDQE